ncbi:MAG: orotidine 5'-phosphate decarboxylase / HUMPS family protein [Patescibacteria group bacterium]
MRRVVILPFDGIPDATQLLARMWETVSKKSINKMLAYVKVNDGIHNYDCGGPALVAKIKEMLRIEIGPEVGLFLDLKVFDVSATLENYAKKYAAFQPDILTVSSQCSVDGIIALRKALPATKLAMVSALTDMSVDECQRRFGMHPVVKIFNDLANIRSEYQKKNAGTYPDEPFDLIVCSPQEVRILKNNLPASYGFIVPGIRDSWMLSDHQQRTTGVREALDLGASYVVMGAQLTKGNPQNDVSAVMSQDFTMAEIEKSSAILIEADPLLTLKNCQGYYCSPKDKVGNFIGPLVAYAGTYEDESGQKKNKVGFEYFNFAKAEEIPLVRDYFARIIVDSLKREGIVPSLVIGAPMGGILLAGDIARHLNCRSIFAEKKVVALADPDKGIKEKSEQIIDRHDILPGDRVLIVEDICNNFSTTDKLATLIQSRGAEVVAIACAFNRSGQKDVVVGAGASLPVLPVISACFVSADQFCQNDDRVASLVAAGKIVWRPKQEWSVLKQAMED